MLTFFRKIRKSLLDSGNSTRYLTYAIGEILLVMVGILLALQVNNWNEANKLRTTEVKMLEELAIALTHDRRNMGINIRSYLQTNRSIEIILQQLAHDKPTDDSLGFHFARSLHFNSVSPTIGPYETLKSKGLELISTDSIRAQIIGVYEVTYKYYLDNARNLFMTEEHFQHYCLNLFDSVAWRQRGKGITNLIPHDYQALRRDKMYRSLLNTRKAQAEIGLGSLERNIEIVEKLISDIRKEIDSLTGFD